MIVFVSVSFEIHCSGFNNLFVEIILNFLVRKKLGHSMEPKGS